MKKLILLLLLVYSCEKPKPKDTYHLDKFTEYLVKGHLNGRIPTNDVKYMNEFIRIERTGQIDSIIFFMHKFKRFVNQGDEFKF
jgi:hypothetical protein